MGNPHFWRSWPTIFYVCMHRKAFFSGIVAALGDLRVLAKAIAATPKPFHLTVTETRTGLDIAAVGAGRLGEKQRRAVIDLALEKGFARLSADGEIIVEGQKPSVMFGEVPVAIPPAGFLQATLAAMQAQRSPTFEVGKRSTGGGCLCVCVCACACAREFLFCVCVCAPFPSDKSTCACVNWSLTAPSPLVLSCLLCS